MAVNIWPATRRREAPHRDINHGVETSPITAPANSAAVAAPAAPWGPMRSKRTGATGSKTEKLIEMEIPTLARVRIEGPAPAACPGLRSG